MTTNLTQVASAIVASAKHDLTSKAQAAELGKLMVALFIDASASDAEFVRIFGNGRPHKAADYVAGSLSDAVRGALKGKPKALAEAALNVLKVRLSEARRLRKAGGFPNPTDNNLQATLKRYVTPAAPKATPAKEEPAAAVIIADGASIDDVAEALSIWVAKHGAAAAGLATRLKDFLPVTVKRGRAA